MGVKPVDRRMSARMDDGLGARKRVFIPGYSGVISRMQETIAGTFAQTSRDSHYLVYHGCKPSMDAATLPSPDTFYSRKPNPRIKTNAANRSNFSFGDERDWGFETLNETQFRIPTKIPPRHASILPGGPNGSKDQLDVAYVSSLTKVGVAGVKRLEQAIRAKIDQRTTGGPMALRKAFKFFDTDASGDIDPDEFYAAMHAFGLEFTEDQVLALFGYYDTDRDGSLSYYEFIDKVLESGFGLDTGPKPAPVMVQLAPINDERADVEVRTVLRADDIHEKSCRDIFDRFDANKSGEIDIRELQQLTRALGLSMDRESINNAMFELDQNRNGTISFDEFWSWWQYAALRKGNQAAPRTGGAKAAAPNNKTSTSRPNSQQATKFDMRPNSRQTDKITEARGMRRPKSEQSMHRTLDQYNFGGGGAPRPVAGGLSRPGSRESSGALGGLKSALLGLDADKASSRSGLQGQWMTQNQGRQSLSSAGGMRPSRPGTRNSTRSVAGEDYSPPPILSRPPKLYGLSRGGMHLPPRPNTAPTDLMAEEHYLRVPGTPAVPLGVTTGYVL